MQLGEEAVQTLEENKFLDRRGDELERSLKLATTQVDFVVGKAVVESEQNKVLGTELSQSRRELDSVQTRLGAEIIESQRYKAETERLETEVVELGQDMDQRSQTFDTQMKNVRTKATESRKMIDNLRDQVRAKDNEIAILQQSAMVNPLDRAARKPPT